MGDIFDQLEAGYQSGGSGSSNQFDQLEQGYQASLAAQPPTGPLAAEAMGHTLGGFASLGDLAQTIDKYNPLGGLYKTITDKIMGAQDFAPHAGDYINQAIDWATGIKNTSQINGNDGLVGKISDQIIPGLALGPEKIAQNLALSATAGTGAYLGKQSAPTIADITGLDPATVAPYSEAAGAMLAPAAGYAGLRALSGVGSALSKFGEAIKPLTAVEEEMANLGIPKSEFKNSAKTISQYSPEQTPLSTTLENLKARGAFTGKTPEELINWNASETKRLGDKVQQYLKTIDYTGTKPEINWSKADELVANAAREDQPLLRRKLDIAKKQIENKWDGTALGLNEEKQRLYRKGWSSNSNSAVRKLTQAMGSDLRASLENAAESAFPGKGGNKLAILNGAQGDNITFSKILTNNKAAMEHAALNRSAEGWGSASKQLINDVIGKPAAQVLSPLARGAGAVGQKIGSFVDSVPWGRNPIWAKQEPVVQKDILKAIGWTPQLEGEAKLTLPSGPLHPESRVYQERLPAIQSAKKAGELLPGYPNVNSLSTDIMKITWMSPEKAKIAAQAYKQMKDAEILATMESKVGGARSVEKWNPSTGKFETSPTVDPMREFGVSMKARRGAAKIGAMGAAGVLSGALLNDKTTGVSGLSPAFGSISAPTSAKKNDIINETPMSASSDKIAAKLVPAMIKQESGGKANAVSKAGAVGLMQLMPATGKEWHAKLGLPGEYNPKDPTQNKTIGKAYISWLIDQFDGDVALALTAYNQGIGRVKKLLNMTGGTTLEDIKPKLGPDGQKYAQLVLNKMRA